MKEIEEDFIYYKFLKIVKLVLRNTALGNNKVTNLLYYIYKTLLVPYITLLVNKYIKEGI